MRLEMRNENALTLKALICVLWALKILLGDYLNKYTKNFACKNGDKFTRLHVLGTFFGVGGHLSMWKLRCEFVATAALFAHTHVVRAELLSFSFDYGAKLCMQAASTAHSLCCSTFTLCFTCRMFVCLQPELYLRGLKGNLVVPSIVFCQRHQQIFEVLLPGEWLLVFA